MANSTKKEGERRSMSGNNPNGNGQPQLALALGGGGARAAYQAGVLRGIAEQFPEFRAPLLTGVSAGAINVAHLANHTGTFRQKIDDLAKLWQGLRFEDVFTIEPASLIWRVTRIGLRLSVGMPPGIARANSMVDTKPLRQFLFRSLGIETEVLSGIRKNIEAGELSAAALTALNYDTGESVTFVEGKAIEDWEQPLRKGVKTRLNVEHIMASAALPLLFSPIRIGNDWYGDGGIRLVAPLSPAVHLGADRLLVISTHYEFPPQCKLRKKVEGPPSPAVVLGALYNAVFLDQLDSDAVQIERINNLLRKLQPQDRRGLREIETVVIRPSADLGALANQFEAKLPGAFRYFMRRFGSKEAEEQDLISTVMFHKDYIDELLRLGERDASMHADAIAKLLVK
jgi:NTE family protein